MINSTDNSPGKNKGSVGVPVPKYRQSKCVCWRCGKKTAVYSWVGKKLFGVKTPPQPMPKTLRYKFSKQAGHNYWVNTCFYCGSIQGDWFLYCEPDGVFFDEEKFEDLFEGGVVT